MTDENAPPPARADEDYPWLRDGSVPHSREDLVAEALALIALIFSVGIGLVIALLPVSATAVTPAGRAAATTPPAAASPDLRPSPSTGR